MKDIIGSKDAARFRSLKKKGKLNAKNAAKLDAYEKAKDRGDLKGMRAAFAPAPEPVDPAAQPEGAPPAEPVVEPITEPAPEQPADPLPPPPPVEMATPKASNDRGGRWQDKYPIAGGNSLDGREMLCVFIADNAVGVLEAFAADLKLVNKDPIIAPQMLRNVWIQGLDQVLPDRAKLTPPVAMMVGSAAIGVQRIVNHKAIVEAQAKDPGVQAYKREQAETRAREHAEREATKAAPAPAPAPEVRHAAPPPEAPPPNVASKREQPPTVAPPATPTDAPINGAGVAADGKLFA